MKVTIKDGRLDFKVVEAALPTLAKPDEVGDGGSDSEQEIVE